jgi:RNA polymerase sigma-70 factor (ECF subfamily)
MSMETPASLLERLRQPDDQEAWSQLVRLYAPLLHHWSRRLGLGEADAADLVQEVFAVLVRKLPEFRYDRQGSFRGWLRTIIHNRWRDLQRHRAAGPREVGDGALPHVEGPDNADEFTESEYRQHLAVRALQLMQSEFPHATWKACWEQVVEGRPASEVASELGMTVNSAYLARSRVLARLRQAMHGLLD